jgi:hypothetical protein
MLTSSSQSPLLMRTWRDPTIEMLFSIKNSGSTLTVSKNQVLHKERKPKIIFRKVIINYLVKKKKSQLPITNSQLQRSLEESQSWTFQVSTLSSRSSWRTSNMIKSTFNRLITFLISSWQGLRVQYPLELTSFASLFWSILFTTRIQLSPQNFITNCSRR